MEKLGNAEYDYKSRADGVTIDTSRQILWEGQDIRVVLRCQIDLSFVVCPIDPYDRSSKKINFNPQIQAICNDIFPIFPEIRKKDIFASASMASYLFEQFTDYWTRLLDRGQDVLGIRLWEYVLEITEEWEKINKEEIHKGTPYFFLAENYLLIGDRDLAFAYLLTGFMGDKTFGEKTTVGNYPWESPGYFTAIMSDDPRNQMRPIVLKLRGYLNQFIISYRNEFNSNFTLDDFDKKFLRDRDLVNFVLFFHYNFFYIYDLYVNRKGKYLQDDFSKLRGLDVFLNLALIIDEVLKEVYKKNNNGKLLPKHYISTGIRCLNNIHTWMSDTDLRDYWYQQLKLEIIEFEPDVVLPTLLKKSGTHNGNPIPKEIFTLTIAFAFRNFGAHNIKQQNSVVADYEEIIKNLLYSLFISIENL
jgi:hypothetical protein